MDIKEVIFSEFNKNGFGKLILKILFIILIIIIISLLKVKLN